MIFYDVSIKIIFIAFSNIHKSVTSKRTEEKKVARERAGKKGPERDGEENERLRPRGIKRLDKCRQ